MSTTTKVTGFVVALVVVFGLALGIGKAFGPDTGPSAAAHDSHTEEPVTALPARPDAADNPGGLMVSQDGSPSPWPNPAPRPGRTGR